MLDNAASSSGKKAKLLVTVGAFAAIYFVLMFASGMLGFAGPAFMLVGGILGVLLNGTVIMLLLAKTRQMWVMTSVGFVTGLLMQVTGHPWTVLLLAVLLGLAADLVSCAGSRPSQYKDMVAYAIFTLWYVGPLLPIFYASDDYFANIAQQMGGDYSSRMRQLFTPAVLVGWMAAMFLVGLFSAWSGGRIVRKHFAKAGVV